MTLSGDQLDLIVRQISSVTQPAGIILFGSHARGEATEGSDVDLLVIRENEFADGESRMKELGSIYRAVSEVLAVPKDILLFTKGEFASWRHTTNHMVAIAHREGRVISGKI